MEFIGNTNMDELIFADHSVDLAISQCGFEYSDTENTAFIAALAKYYTDKERLAEAEELLRKAVAEHPEDDQIKILLVRFLSSSKGVDPVLVELQAMVKADPQNYVIRELLGAQLAAMGDVEGAESIFKGTVNYDVNSDCRVGSNTAATTIPSTTVCLAWLRSNLVSAISIRSKRGSKRTLPARLQLHLTLHFSGRSG